VHAPECFPRLAAASPIGWVRHSDELVGKAAMDSAGGTGGLWVDRLRDERGRSAGAAGGPGLACGRRLGQHAAGADRFGPFKPGARHLGLLFCRSGVAGGSSHFCGELLRGGGRVSEEMERDKCYLGAFWRADVAIYWVFAES